MHQLFSVPLKQTRTIKRYPIVNRKSNVAAILLLVFLASCTPASTPTITPTVLPEETPTTIPTAIPTAIPFSTVTGRAVLSTSPELDACASQSLLPEGSQVFVTGLYGDYAKVEFQNGGVLEKGFLPKQNLNGIPADVMELGINDIPWKTVVDYSAWEYFFAEEQAIIFSPDSEEKSDWASDPTNHPVPAPLRIRFGLQSDSNTWAAVKLTGMPQQEPWWQDLTRMDIFSNGETYELCVRDGTTEGCTAAIPLPIPTDEEVVLLFPDQFGKSLQVLDETNTVVTTLEFTSYPGLKLPNGIFPNGWFQFGLTVGSGTLKIIHPSLTTPPTGIFESSWLYEPGLAELAKPHNILIGTEFSLDLMSDARYCGAIHHDFNLGALSAFTDAKIWRGPGDYDFLTLDQIVDKTIENGLTPYASHLVWGSYDPGVLPEWLKNGNYSRDELLAILEEHITTMVTRYKGKVKIWSIANEAPERDRYRGADFWFDHIGPDYVRRSFEWARQADPDATLLLNAANNESRRDAETTYNVNTLYSMVKSMKEQGTPIDAVGMQMHLFLPWSSKVLPKQEDVEFTMKKFGELGVQVMITEMDVNLHEIPGTEQEKIDTQTRLYAEMMSACINSDVCTVFATWGVSDATSWISSPDSQWVYKTHTPDAAPLLFDIDYLPKAAYFALKEVLTGGYPK